MLAHLTHLHEFQAEQKMPIQLQHIHAQVEIFSLTMDLELLAQVKLYYPHHENQC